MKNITLTLLATTILTAAALPAFAAAPKEPEIYFYPSKTWIVGNGATPTDCAVQSEFNNGFVLQFDGSKDWVQSFSVNFRQNIFTEGQTYPVTLSAPGKASKQFQATATGASMITVPLQNDKEVYQGARDGAVMDVKIDDNSFRFYLVNFAPAAQKFETCMAGGDMNAVPAQPQPAAAPVQDPKPATQREVSNSIPQGNTAPPPPRGDVQTTATLNESIEFEQAEQQNVPITEITPQNPKATVQEIPYTETVKLGDQVVTSDDAPILSSNHQPAPASPAPYRKRMSEQLAEEMSRSNTASDMNNPAPLAAAPIESMDAAPIEAPIEAQAEEPKSPPPAMNESQMAVPPTIEEPQGKRSPQKLAEADAQIIAPPPAQEEIQAFEQPEQSQSQAQALAAQKPAQEPDSLDQANLAPPPGAHPSSTPFSQRGEVIRTDKEPGEKQAVRQPEPEFVPEPAPAQEPVRQVKTEKFETPEVKVNKQTARMEADFTQLDAVEPASQQDDFDGARRADPEMLLKISELEKKINTLEKENTALNDELTTSVRGAEEERMSIASENWNLERATMRFNEAERQIKKLGEQIQRERALCQDDKKGLEAQLFDPQITEQQQLARLADLEQQLASAEQKLEEQRVRYEDRIRILQSQSATQ
jgi:hypothetical protein